MSCIEEGPGATTVVMSPRVYHCGYVGIGVCRCVRVVVLEILPRGAVCLCRVNKVVMNTAGFGIR